MNYITVGIDLSTTACGLATFLDGKFVMAGGIYPPKKMPIAERVDYIFDKIDGFFEELSEGSKNAKGLVIIEEPIFAGNNGMVTRWLSQLAGGVYVLARQRGHDVKFFYAISWRKALAFKSKKTKDLKLESLKRVAELYPSIEQLDDNIADAINIVDGYKVYIAKNEEKNKK